MIAQPIAPALPGLGNPNFQHRRRYRSITAEACACKAGQGAWRQWSAAHATLRPVAL